MKSQFRKIKPQLPDIVRLCDIVTIIRIKVTTRKVKVAITRCKFTL